jgi:hypothetical protein
VIVPGTAMDDEGYGPLAHALPVRNEPSPDHIEIDFGISHTRPHGCLPVLL